MSSTEVTILARSAFTTKGPDNKDHQEMRVTFQMPDGRIGTYVIQADVANTPKEDLAIAAAIKALPTSAIERRTIKTG